MPKFVDIGIFKVGKTVVDKEEVQRWLDFIGVKEFTLPEDGAVTNPALLIALAAKRCYKSFEVGLNKNISKVRKNYAEYFDNILKSGHGSVLEHSVFNFAIENVSRVFTAEMNRHRAGWAISEGSMRFIRYSEEIPLWCPDSIKGEDVMVEPEGNFFETIESYVEGAGNWNDGLMSFVDDADEFFWTDEARKLVGAEPGGDLTEDQDDALMLLLRKQLSRAVFYQSFAHQEEMYRLLENIWDMDESDHNFAYKKKVTSMMRRIIGMGVATGGVWSGNIRALRHVITMRASPAAEEEILHVFSRVAKMMRDSEPSLFGDFEQTPEGFWVPRYLKV